MITDVLLAIAVCELFVAVCELAAIFGKLEDKKNGD